MEKADQVVRLRNGIAISVIINDLVGSDEYRQKAQLGAVPLPDTSVDSIKIIYRYMTDLASIPSQTDIQMESNGRSK